MTGRSPSAVRREVERKARREGAALVADLPLGARAYKEDGAGRWVVTLPPR
ncbi:MAG: hypothetical protein ACRENE_03710 [Polyangiaceae bacterium]